MYKKIIYYIIFISFVNCIENCDSDSLVCEERKLINYIDEIEKVHIAGDYISLEKITERSGRKIDREEDIIERSLRFLQEHELKIRLPETFEDQTIVEGKPY